MTLWDRWDVKHEAGKKITLKILFEHLIKEYKLYPKDVLVGTKPVLNF